jgi:hypothetical protein
VGLGEGSGSDAARAAHYGSAGRGGAGTVLWAQVRCRCCRGSSVAIARIASRGGWGALGQGSVALRVALCLALLAPGGGAADAGLLELR